MKLTDPQSIQESEKELIDVIHASLDWKTVEKLLTEKQLLDLETRVFCQNGDLVIHDNQIAYKLDFEVTVPLSIVFNRQGECLDIATSHGNEKISGRNQASDMAELKERSSGKVEQLAASIADMISEINRKEESI